MNNILQKLEAAVQATAASNESVVRGSTAAYKNDNGGGYVFTLRPSHLKELVEWLDLYEGELHGITFFVSSKGFRSLPARPFVPKQNGNQVVAERDNLGA